MGIVEVKNKKSIAPLFFGWRETFIWSYLQGYMGTAYAQDTPCPKSALITVGDFWLYGGQPNAALAKFVPQNPPDGAILAPQNDRWLSELELAYGDRAQRHTRYATKKERGAFDVEKLRGFANGPKPPYRLKRIDRELYGRIMRLDWAKDLCVNFACYKEYEKLGLGVVALKGDEIVCGASSYIVYSGGIEVEVDTRQDERRRGLATACAAQLILLCLQQNKYPSWDAHNKESLALAQKLGYLFDREYVVVMPLNGG